MNLKETRAAALKAAQDIVDGAKVAGRSLSDTEQAEVNAKFAEIDELDKKIKAADESDALMGRIAGLAPAAVVEAGEDRPAKSLGEHFVKAAHAQAGDRAFSLLKERGGFTIATPEYKAATDPQTTPGAFSPLLTQVDPNVVRGYRRAVVSDVLGTGTLGANSNAVTYFVESAVEGGFTTVAVGGQKPQLHVADPTPVTDSVKKIAAWWDTADEMTEDAEFWVSEINNRAMYLLSLAEENQLLNGDGTGANILGLLNRSGIQTQTQGATGDFAQDAIFRAMTQVQTAAGLTADAILINPADYQTMRLAKNGQGEYYGGGMFYAGDYGPDPVQFQPPIWGVRTIVTPAVPAKTAVVGAFKVAATVYRKGGVRVESTNSDQGKFTKNIVTTRIEERVGLAVRVPLGIVKVTLV